MEVASRQQLRADDEAVRTHLERLRRCARPPTGIELRATTRFDYAGHAFTLEILGEDGEPVARHGVVTRNLSQGGMACLAGGFIYPGTACRVRLRNVHGQEQLVTGVVARCRYLLGSRLLHEVGIRFRRGIDVELFAPHAKLIRILLVDESPAVERLIARFLDKRQVQVTGVSTAQHAVNAALTFKFDLLLLDLESAGFDAFEVTRTLRANGYLGPVVGLAVQAGASLRERCEQAGCTGYLMKPLTRGALENLVDSLVEPPLISSRADDATLVPLINHFVRGLPDLARELSAAFEAGDLEMVYDIARGLRAEAGSYGFEAITRAAEHVQALAGVEASAGHVRPALYELVHLCLIARPASVDDEAAAL